MSFFNLVKYFNIIEKIQYTLIIIMILSLPYNIIAPRFSLLLSILIFIFASLYPKRSLESLFQHKVILYLFGFILLTYLSVLWTPAKDMFGGNFKVNIYAYLNYFFLIPGIYLSQLDKNKLQYLILFFILSPIIYMIIYYTNFLGLTTIYSYNYWTDTPHIYYTHILYVDLFANIFLLFSSLFIYIKLINLIMVKKYKYAFLLSLIFLFVSLTLFIDDLTSSRIINLTYLISIAFISSFFFSKKLRYIIIMMFMLLIGVFLLNSSSYQEGFSQLKKSYDSGQHIGSWPIRLNLANYGLKMYTEHPFVGRGITDIIDTMKKVKIEHQSDFVGPYLHFHNQHILILVQVGIIGYIIFLFFIFNYYRVPIKNKEFNLYQKVTILIYFILMCGEHYLQMVHTSTLFALLFAIYISYYQEENEIKYN